MYEPKCQSQIFGISLYITIWKDILIKVIKNWAHITISTFSSAYSAQGAAKLQEVKVGRQKKRWKTLAEHTINIGKKNWQKIFHTSNFDLWQFCHSLHLMDVLYLIWKSSQFLNGIVPSQERSSTFKVWYLRSKYPHLNSAFSSRV